MGNCKMRLTSWTIQKLYIFEAYSFSFIAFNRRFSWGKILRKPQTKETLWICASKVIEIHLELEDATTAVGEGRHEVFFFTVLPPKMWTFPH